MVQNTEAWKVWPSTYNSGEDGIFSKEKPAQSGFEEDCKRKSLCYSLYELIK